VSNRIEVELGPRNIIGVQFRSAVRIVSPEKSGGALAGPDPQLRAGAIRRSGGVERPLARPDECLTFSLRRYDEDIYLGIAMRRGRLGGTPKCFVPQAHMPSITGISSVPASLRK
jgi:hypothetical protein